MRTTAFNAALILDRLAVATPPLLYGLGVCCLGGKLLPVPAWLTPGVLGLAALACLVVILAVGAARDADGWFTPEYAAAWLDWRNRAGGRIIAAGGSDPRAVSVLPAVSARHLAGRLVLPVLFLAAALLVPAPAARERLSGADMGREIARLEREVEDAWDAGALTEPDAREMLRQLQRMRELAERDPQSAAEALSTLPAKVEEARARRMELAAEALEKAAAAKAAWEGGLDAEGLESRMAEYRRALESLAKGEGGTERMSPELAAAMNDAARQVGQDAGAGEAGGGGASRTANIGSLDQMMQALEKHAGVLARADGAVPGGTGSSAGRQMALSRLQTLSEALAQGAEPGAASGETPGSGGVDRGRADAPLVVGDRSEAGDLSVDYRPLPPGGGNAGDTLLRRERHAPEGELPPEEFRAPGARSGVVPDRVRAGRGGAGFGPARERAVERYFEELTPVMR